MTFVSSRARHSWRLAAPVLALALAWTNSSDARETWRGDMETGTLGQWSYQLNGEGLSVADDVVLYGKHAAKVRITPENLWSNGLNRVELQRKPALELTQNGKQVYFGWSLYLPTALSADDHQLGYWETQETYTQVMSLHARGQDLSFNTNQPAAEHWRGAGRLTPGVWHRVVFHVVWSDQADAGKVSLWFDGERVVDNVTARTYLGQPAFIQIGILRDTIDAVETLYLDEAFEGSSYEDVALSNGAPPPQATPRSRESKGCSIARGSALPLGFTPLFGLALWAAWGIRRARSVKRRIVATAERRGQVVRPVAFHERNGASGSTREG